MKNLYYILLISYFCIVGSALFAQNVHDDRYFDPEIDAIGKVVHGQFLFVVPEEALVRSVKTHLSGVGIIERIDRYQHGNDWYMTINCRHADDIEQSVLIGLLLKTDEEGNYYADNFWFACTGKGCGVCQDYNMERCFCTYDKPGELGTPGYCSRTESDDPLLGKVLIQE